MAGRGRRWLAVAASCLVGVALVAALAGLWGGGRAGMDAAAADIGRYQVHLGACRVGAMALLWWRWRDVVRTAAARRWTRSPQLLYARRHVYLAAGVGFEVVFVQGLAAWLLGLVL